MTQEQLKAMIVEKMKKQENVLPNFSKKLLAAAEK